MTEGIDFSKGLVPCTVQDAASGEVLMVAFVNEAALELTLRTREMHFWSRSREEIWRKGATSGATQRLVSLRYDCDGDALLALVEPAGPACHTGERTCFYRDVEGSADPAPDAPPVDGEPEAATFEALPRLQRVLASRRQERPDGSYTVELLDDPGRIGEKIREEAAEVSVAIAEESDERVAEEAADVLYHLAVGLASRGLTLATALDVLNERRRGR
jgi:phosphoribosyl-ATP pyrophosphohydrolase/phosphoribosyl-AMP cyclohydrolase